MKEQAVFQIVNTEYEWLTHIKIDPEYSQLVPELSEEEYARLKESIASVGLYEPIIINQEGTLLDGHHRLKVVKELGWSRVNVETKVFDSRIDEQIYVIETNLSRRHLIAAMRIKLARSIYELNLQKQAKKQQGTRTDLTFSSEEEKVDPIDTDKVIAEKSATSKASVYRVKKIMDEGTPEEKALLFSNEGKIKTAFKEFTNRTTPKNPKTKTPPLPNEKYRCLIIDPPWEMEKISRDERPNQGKYLDYPTMTIEELEKLPIKELADKEGCHIYLWTTHKHLPDALKIFESWGAKYQCLMTWVKPTGMTPFSWMYNTEHVLFGRIGSLKLEKLGIKLAFNEKSREHSRKPDVFYNIVKQASPEPRLDMFSRESREGFNLWGNEVNKFDEI